MHERCDTPVEFLVTPQWFIRVLENKQKFLELGEQIRWHPEHMHARYHAWVENLNWDWCISRQRYFGVPFPVWYCKACGEMLLADEAELPVDPLAQAAGPALRLRLDGFRARRGHHGYLGDFSVSPQIVTGWLDELTAL